MSTLSSIQRRRRIRERTQGQTPSRPTTTLPSITSATRRQLDDEFIKGLKRKPKPSPKTKLPPIPSAFANKIPKSILDLYPTMPKGTLKDINNNIIITNLTKSNRDDIRIELATLVGKKNRGVILCHSLIGAGFIDSTVEDKKGKTKGYVLHYKGTMIGFMFYKINRSKTTFKIELVCANKGRGNLKGMPLGRILLDLLNIIIRRNPVKVKSIKLEAIPKQETVDFYKGIGFKKTKGKPDEEGLIPMTKKL